MEILKIRAELNETENKKTIQKINATKALWFSEKINKIDKLLAIPTKEKREKIQINKIRNKRAVTTNTTDKQRTILESYERLYTTKLNN